MSSSIPQTSGIYKVVCLPNGKVYVGSAVNLHQRHLDHWQKLSRCQHRNIHLQRAWNKYGEQAFIFEVIELVLASFILEREQYWIDKLHCCDDRKGFNISPTAGSSFGIRHSEDFRRARSEDQKRLWRIPEYRRHTIDAHSNKWVVIDPDGNEHVVFNLRQFCREHGLHSGHMSGVARGYKRTQHKGWRCRRLDDEV
jgi:hypothetical protein